MGTLSVSLPVNGAAQVTAGLAAEKTFLVDGLDGAVTIEASVDGTNFCPVATFSKAKEIRTISICAESMRAVSATGSATVAVTADQSSVKSVSLPSPPSSGPGAAVDITALGAVTTAFASGMAGGTVAIELSPDGIVWSSEFKTFANADCVTKRVSAKFARAVGRNSSGVLSLCSEDTDGAVNATPLPHLTFAPEHPLGNHGNVYVNWPDLHAAVIATVGQGRRYIYFDCSYSTTLVSGLPACVIPAGDATNGAIFNAGLGRFEWNMREVVWTNTWDGFGNQTFPGLPTYPTTTIAFATGAFISALNTIEMTSCRLVNIGTTTPLRGFIEFLGRGGENIMQTDGAGAAPVWEDNGPFFFTVIAMNRWRTAPGLTPVLKVEGFTIFESVGQTRIADGTFTGGGFCMCFIHDDGAMVDTDFPAAFADALSGPPDPVGFICETTNPFQGGRGFIRPGRRRLALVSGPAYTAEYGELVVVDSTANPVTVSLPQAAGTRDNIKVKWRAGGNPVTVAPLLGGETVESGGVLAVVGDVAEWTSDASSDWILTSK